MEKGREVGRERERERQSATNSSIRHIKDFMLLVLSVKSPRAFN